MALLAAIISAATAQNASSGSSQTCEALSVDNISPLVVKAEYAVRGRLLARAMELEAVLKAGGDGAAALPFKRIVRCNIGNPQAVGQKPTTFVRQVLSLVMNPAQLSGLSKWAYPKDAIARAKHYLAGIPSLGAYSDSQGIMSVRKEVADFIAARDGHPASPSDIFLTDGASAGVKALMQLLVRGPHDAVLVPVPQYPLYSAVTTLLNGTLAPYYLDEDAAWGVQEAELRRALTAAKAGGATTRALCVINPGNPTGQSLPRAAVESILRFAAKEKLVLMADEVRTAAAAAAQFGAQFGAQLAAQFSHPLRLSAPRRCTRRMCTATRRRSSRSRKCCPRWRRRATRRRAACSSCRSTRRPKASSASAASAAATSRWSTSTARCARSC